MPRITLIVLSAFVGIANAEYWISTRGPVEIGSSSPIGPSTVLVIPNQQWTMLAKLQDPDRLDLNPFGPSFFWDSNTAGKIDLTVDFQTFRLVSTPDTRLDFYTSTVGPPIEVGGGYTYGFRLQFQNLLPIVLQPSPGVVYNPDFPSTAFLSVEFFSNRFPPSSFPTGDFSGQGYMEGEAQISVFSTGATGIRQPRFGGDISSISVAVVPEASSFIFASVAFAVPAFAYVRRFLQCLCFI
jgi:hypothetical protein